MAEAKLVEGRHDGKDMHFHVEGRCKGWTMKIRPGDDFGLHLPGQCSSLPRSRKYTAGDEPIEEEILEQEQKPPKKPVYDDPKKAFRGHDCCGSNGPRHLKDCPGKRPLELGGKPLEGYLVDYRSDCCGDLVVPGASGGYRCLGCDRPCGPKKQAP